MDYVSVREAAQRLGVSVPTIRRRILHDEFSPSPARVNGRWRIPLAALVNALESGSAGSKWLVRGGLIDRWVRAHLAGMRRFVEEVLMQAAPTLIIVRHRKGERLFSALELIPQRFKAITFHIEYLEMLPERERQELLKSARVVIFDDTIQRGRAVALQSEWLVGQAPNVTVKIACLLLRRTVADRALPVSEINAYAVLDDFSYRVATAELSRVARCLWPFDVEHPTLWCRLPPEVTESDIIAALGQIGAVVALPALAPGQSMRLWSIEEPKMPRFERLGLPPIASPWPGKVRCIWLRDDNILFFAGIYFPTLQASTAWLQRFRPKGVRTWETYLGLEDGEQWLELTVEQRATRIFRAFALHAGAQLLASSVPVAMKRLGVSEWRSALRVEAEDLYRVYGPKVGGELVNAIRRAVTAAPDPRASQIQLQNPEEPMKQPGALTIEEFVQPLTALILTARHAAVARGVQFSGVTKDELATQVSDPDELRTMRTRYDVALDYGYCAPVNRLTVVDDEVRLERAFDGSENNEDGRFLASRINVAAPLLVIGFNEAAGIASINRYTFHKLFVNLQANLSGGLINPSDLDQLHMLVFEQGHFFGPMAYTPDVLTPYEQVPLDQYLIERQRMTLSWDPRTGESQIKVPATFDRGKALTMLEEEWRVSASSLLGDSQLFAKLYGSVTKTDIYKGPTRGDLLTAIAACSTHDRLVRYSLEDLKLWKQHAQMCVAGIVDATLGSKEPLLDTDIRDMGAAGAAFGEKVGWYVGLPDWRSVVERVPTGPDLLASLAKERLLRRIAFEPEWGRPTGPSLARRLVSLAPAIRCFSYLLRHVTSERRLVADSLKIKRRTASVCDGFDPSDHAHDFCSAQEALLALQAQGPPSIESVSDEIYGLMRDIRARESLDAIWAKLSSIVAGTIVACTSES